MRGERVSGGLSDGAGGPLELKVQEETLCRGVALELHDRQRVEISGEVVRPRIVEEPLARLAVEDDGFVGTAVKGGVILRARIALKYDVREFHLGHEFLLAGYILTMIPDGF